MRLVAQHTSIYLLVLCIGKFQLVEVYSGLPCWHESPLAFAQVTTIQIPAYLCDIYRTLLRDMVGTKILYLLMTKVIILNWASPRLLECQDRF